MDKGNPETKGRGIRIKHHFLIRYRERKLGSEPRWDISSVINISKSGVLFKASSFHKPGSELELKLRDPLLSLESTLWTKVIRCKPTEAKGVYEIAAIITRIEEGTREAFDKTIDFFIKKEREKE